MALWIAISAMLAALLLGLIIGAAIGYRIGLQDGLKIDQEMVDLIVERVMLARRRQLQDAQRTSEPREGAVPARIHTARIGGAPKRS